MNSLPHRDWASHLCLLTSRLLLMLPLWNWIRPRRSALHLASKASNSSHPMRWNHRCACRPAWTSGHLGYRTHRRLPRLQRGARRRLLHSDATQTSCRRPVATAQFGKVSHLTTAPSTTRPSLANLLRTSLRCGRHLQRRPATHPHRRQSANRQKPLLQAFSVPRLYQLSLARLFLRNLLHGAMDLCHPCHLHR